MKIEKLRKKLAEIERRIELSKKYKGDFHFDSGSFNYNNESRRAKLQKKIIKILAKQSEKCGEEGK